MATDIRDLNKLVQEANEPFEALRREIGKVIVGQEAVIEALLIALLSNGHILLEGLPGLAKTLTITSLAKIIDCDFKRIQFTPDLLPADLIGTVIYLPQEAKFQVKKGPIFSNIVLADEINRAPPKVQSALLEVMQEKQVTIDGESFKVGDPFLVLATQNPIEQEGTYPLPEAQTDRFLMKVRVGYPTRKEEAEILRRQSQTKKQVHLQNLLSSQSIIDTRELIEEIYIDEKVSEYILDIVFATREPESFGLDLSKYIEIGASPRSSIALTKSARAKAFLAGRGYVTPNDVKSLAHNILRHRIKLTYEAEAQELDADKLLDDILDTIPVP